MSEVTALNTKVRGMKQKLFTPADWEAAENIRTLSDLYQLLSAHPGYHEVLVHLDKNALSAETLIEALSEAIFHDFYKLYLFASFKQKEILQLYGLRFEAAFIEQAIKRADSKRALRLIDPAFTRYLDRHRGFQTTETVTRESPASVIDTFQNTAFAPYFNSHRALFTADQYDHQQFEATFPPYVRRIFFERAKRILTKADFEAVKTLWARDVDITNATTLFRLKFFYQAEDSVIKQQLLPYGRALSGDTVEQLLAIPDRAAFIQSVARLGYGDVFDDETERPLSRTEARRVYYQLEAKLTKQLPETLFPALHYLTADKGSEVTRLIRLTERIRFHQRVSSL